MSVSGPMVKMTVSLVHYLSHQTVTPTRTWAPLSGRGARTEVSYPMATTRWQKRSAAQAQPENPREGVGGAPLVQSRVRLPPQASFPRVGETPARDSG